MNDPSPRSKSLSFTTTTLESKKTSTNNGKPLRVGLQGKGPNCGTLVQDG